MAGRPVEVELEAIYKLRIKQVQKKLDEIKRLENEDEDIVDIEIYLRQRRLRSYISYYRVALDQLKRYGMHYIGHPVEDSWLLELSPDEKEVFLLRFCEKKSFEEIQSSLSEADPKKAKANAQKIYERAYKKVIASIQRSVPG